MKRTPLARRTPLAPGRRKRKAHIPPTIRMIAAARSSGTCVVCGLPGQQLHHVFDEALFPELSTTPENLVAVCIPCHSRHTNAFTRIPLARIPAETLALADGNMRRSLHLDRYYP